MNVSKTTTMASLVLAIASLVLIATPKASAVPVNELLGSNKTLTFRGYVVFVARQGAGQRTSHDRALIVTFSADPATTAERGHLQGTVEGAAMESAPANTQKLDRNVTEPSTDVFLTSPILR